MEKIATAVLTLLMLLPVVLGANPYRRFLKDATFCQEKDAVCKMSSGNYGCCPATDGVCCADGDHCCPSGFECDLSAKQCLQYREPALYVLTEDLLDVAPIDGVRAAHEVTRDLNIEKTMFLMEQAKPGDVGDVKCPDGNSCSDGNTCCLHINGGYGCCEIANANCCDNYMTCCDSGTVCDNANGKCITPTVDVLDRIEFLLKSSRSTQRRL